MEALAKAVDDAVSNKDYESLKHIFSEGWMEIGQGEQRSLAAHFIQAAVSAQDFLASAPLAEMEPVFLAALSHLPAVVPNAADNALRQYLFDTKVSGDDPDYAGAAQILAGLRMEDEASDSVYSMSAAARTDVYVKIAECFLVEEDVSASDSAVTKAGACLEQIEDPSNHAALVLRYKSTYARVLDANRKFLAAAQRYHELCSVETTVMLEEEEMLQLLGKAATCAILAAHGPQRARVLNMIAKDPRIEQLDGMETYSSHRSILQKMQRRQIIPSGSPDLIHLQKGLEEHQTAIMSDGLTILDRGIMDHNLSAVSFIYRSIYFSKLASILGVSQELAQETILERILSGSLAATMDDVEGVITFDPPKQDQEAWDNSISDFCQSISALVDRIGNETGIVPRKPTVVTK